MLRLLVVDDDPNDEELLVHRLRRAGFELEAERVDHEEAFLGALGGADLVICDYAMPLFSPFRALELLREHDRDLPFLLVSGAVGEDIAVEAMKRGASDYLMKDRLERLPSAIHQALEKAELRRRQRATERALAISEERFRLLTENIDEVFFIGNARTAELTYVSPAAERVWGRPRETITNETWTASLHPDDRERMLAGMPRLAHERLVEEYRIVRPDGALRWLRADTFPVRDGGAPASVVGIVRDITEQRALQQQLLQKQKLESIGQLAGGIAHDFNNLLAVIIGCASAIHDEHADPDLHELASSILAAGDRAAALTRKLLVYGRRELIQRARIDLHAAVRDAVAMLRRTLGEHVAISVELAPGALQVHADAGMLELVILELAINAREAMPDGGTLTIETREIVRPGGERFACLQVRDTGRGIPADVLPNIWDPYFTTKFPNGGTGMSLASVYAIVQQHEGWIDLDSRPGEGTAFSVYLPLLAHEPVAPRRTVPPPRDGAILLVEDDHDVRATVMRLLRRRGYTVLEAANGPDAEARWEQHRAAIRILVTDQIMPGGVTGIELAKRLREEDPALGVICMSGYDPGRLERMPETDRWKFLAKPFESEVLTAAIEDLLATR